jgi:predicted esterase
MNARELHIPVRRSARLFVLGDEHAATDIWIVCHGYGQLAARFIREFEPLLAPTRLIVAPEGLHRFYLDPPPAPAASRRVGATWMTREDRAADIRDIVGLLDTVAAHVVADRGRVTLRALGFSQGAAAIFRWAALGRTRIDQLILWAGEVPPDVDMEAAKPRLADTRVVYVEGRDDRMVAGDRQRELLDAAGLSYDVREFAGGHHLDSALLAAIAAAPLH